MKHTVGVSSCRAPRRWAAVGAAFAIVTGGGGLMTASAAEPVGGGGSVFVPITPCRVMDTRADGGNPGIGTHVGPRSKPLQEQEVYTIAVHGKNGNCDIPTTAVGLNVNLTASRATGNSYLTVWAADVERPLASNLNWTPLAEGHNVANVANVDVSADGKISMFSNAGLVDIIIDINGYFTDLTATGGLVEGSITMDELDQYLAEHPGPAGAQGIPGPAGKTVLNGTTVPATNVGVIGDFSIDTTTNQLFGPKTAAGWGTGTSLVGPPGPPGSIDSFTATGLILEGGVLARGNNVLGVTNPAPGRWCIETSLNIVTNVVATPVNLSTTWGSPNAALAIVEFNREVGGFPTSVCAQGNAVLIDTGLGQLVGGVWTNVRANLPFSFIVV